MESKTSFRRSEESELVTQKISKNSEQNQKFLNQKVKNKAFEEKKLEANHFYVTISKI